MARKSRKNVQATPAVVVGPVQYKVALYARISVENEQKREADTIGNQIALLKDFVSQHQDLVVFDLYCDDDISGVSFVRPEFARMMNDIRAGKVTCVIVKDLSRLGRNMIESGEYIEQIFPRMGVRFISVTDRFDSLRDDADISIQLKNFANEAYARDISKKIRAVKRTQQLAGKWTTGTPPYGYMLDPDDKYHLFPDPQTGPIVLAIFRMVAENHTLHFIAKTLNEQGVPSPGRYLYDIGLRKTEKFKDAIWYLQTIKKILVDPVYLGWIVSGKYRSQLCERGTKTNALKNESNSVFNQRRLLQDYYDTHESLHGYKVIVFCDDGVTGTHFDRPKFDELIEMARNQEIHCIMVKDLSRFGRNFLEMGNYLELILPLYGVRFISINDAFDSDDYLGVTGGLELALRNLINNMYSRDLSTKVRSAYRTRNLRGEYWGGSGFYGYQVHPHNKKRLIVDEQVRDIIVMIFESCVAGMTTSEIAQMLNDMGIPSPLEHKRRNGGFYNGVVKEETGIWLKGAVRKILTDERYTGKMITNIRETEEVGKPKMRSLPRDQWIIVPGTHGAIISEELFRAAQNALQGRIRNVNKNTAGNRANNLFVCGCCGRKLRKNPAKEPHLVCPKNDSIKGAECAGLFVNQAQIEQAVLQMLREQSRIFLEQHCLMQACIDKKLSSIQTELDANTNMTRRLQSRKAELYEQYRAGSISREKFADIQKKDSEKLARLSSRAEEIKRLLVEQYESRGNLAAGKRTADQIILLKEYDPEIIRNFVERVRVYPSGEIEIDMRTSSGFAFVTAS